MSVSGDMTLSTVVTLTPLACFSSRTVGSPSSFFRNPTPPTYSIRACVVRVLALVESPVLDRIPLAPALLLPDSRAQNQRQSANRSQNTRACARASASIPCHAGQSVVRKYSEHRRVCEQRVKASTPGCAGHSREALAYFLYLAEVDILQPKLVICARGVHARALFVRVRVNKEERAARPHPSLPPHVLCVHVVSLHVVHLQLGHPMLQSCFSQELVQTAA